MDTVITIEKLLSSYDPDYIDSVLIYVLSARDVPVETLKAEGGSCI
ncbi:hypothetical protein ACDX78_04760 [Virgibacillus oceani]